jgi:hypothetical protein
MSMESERMVEIGEMPEECKAVYAKMEQIRIALKD